MNERIQAALYRYMLAHIKLNTRSELKGLGMVEVADMFATLSPPSIPFEQWAAITQTDLEDREQQNEDFIAAMKGDKIVNPIVGEETPNEE